MQLASIKRSKLYEMKLVTDKRQNMKFNIFSLTNAISSVQVITCPHTGKTEEFLPSTHFFHQSNREKLPHPTSKRNAP